MRLISRPGQPIVADVPFIDQSCVADDAPLALAEGAGTHTGRIEYLDGLKPLDRPLLPGYDDGITALVTGIFVLLALSVSRHSNFLKTFTAALLSGRRANNTFDDHTVAETRITVALLIICCVCEGILLYFASSPGDYADNAFLSIAVATGLAVGLMIFQTTGYCLTGYAFALRQGDALQWVRGFFASQSLLGLVLMLPAFVLIYYPGVTAITVRISAGLYILARLMFIRKGFRFFYTNCFSLIYFILYLCTLEIAPIAFLWRLTLIISDFM